MRLSPQPAVALAERQKIDIENRFSYHKVDAASVEKLAKVREILKEAAMEFARIVPFGREQSSAITKLEEAMMWANAGISRLHPVDKQP